MVKGVKERGLRASSYYYHKSDGFFYHKNRVLSNGTVSLRCIWYESKKCPGRALMKCNMHGFVHKALHNHRASRHFTLVRELREKILMRCRTSDPTPFKHIVQEESLGYSRRVIAQVMPNCMRTAMRRARLSYLPKIPSSLSTLAATLRNPVHRELCQTLDEKDFIYAGSAGNKIDKTRCVIFMSRRMKAFLCKVKRVHSDGTWESRPASPHSSQLLSVVTTINHKMIPLCFVLMESRTQRAYDVVLAKLIVIAPNFQPSDIVCDFERAQMNSWAAAFPGGNVKISGCYFHYVNNVCQQARSLNLAQPMKDDHNVDSLVRSCCAIPLLPPDLLQAGLAAIVLMAEEKDLLNTLGPFLAYIKKEWISRGAVLSVFQCSERTNNCCESMNSLLRKTLGVRRPNIWRFIGVLKRLEEMSVQDIYVLSRGGLVSRQRKTSAIANDEVIQNVTRLLQDNIITLPQFLRRASRRVQNVFDRIFPPALGGQYL